MTTCSNSVVTYSYALENYVGDDQREDPLLTLLKQAEEYWDANPDLADAWVLTARIRFWYTDTQPLCRGLRQLTMSREELLEAIELDPVAQSGTAQSYQTLCTLWHFPGL